ncbi:glycosyltransferase involved in cell wall biosynthesis [Psychrobacter sp. PL15]|uniref:glycosyltransferase family 2 protein n=1 Tax=Psychrobacter sp. PL15 TaxID=3071719 RepID=UPI002E031FFD|nr:glycosyltransferase involved in cell wall biosynthesis [Psychrobacter sp. PL15]
MSVLESDTTIIITTYNDSVADLRCALRSTISQSLLPKHILVVDDGSDTNTAEMVVLAEQTDSIVPITLLVKKNGGPSSARNYGLQHCSTMYVTFLDSDDEMLETNVATKESCLRSLGDDYLGVYGTYIKNPGGLHEYMNHDGLINADLVGKEKGIPGGVPTYLFRTKYLADIGGFDECLVHNEDFDLIIRLANNGLKTKGSLGAGFTRNYRYGSVSRNNRYFEAYENVNRFLDKAEINNYFSQSELAVRRSGNEINLGRKLLMQNGLRKQGLCYLNNAFDYANPKGLKQHLAFIVARSSRVFLRFLR